MNRKLTFVFAVALAILLPIVLIGQEKEGKKGGKKMEKKEGMEMTMTGCFNPGSDSDHFVLKGENGKETVVTGDTAKLTPHAKNHNVTVTGTMEKEKGKDVFKASDLKMNQPPICK